MRHRLFFFAAGLSILMTSFCAAQDSPFGTPPKATTQKWRIGMQVTAPDGPCFGIFATLPVPTDWPEQEVKQIDEESSRHVRSITYRTIDGGVKQMLVSIPQLPAGETATVAVTFEVTRRTIEAPENPESLVVPKRVPRDMSKYLGASPYIETRHAEIRSLARKIAADQPTAWRQVESIYDWVRDNIQYQEGKLKGAVAALRDRSGDCEELTSLFVALCRANKIPARMVWIPNHCYPEFYLQDDQGNGHWIPCQAAGTRAFGSMPETRPVLQKGDSFRVPEKREPQRYVSEFLKIKAVRGTGKPTVRFERVLLE